MATATKPRMTSDGLTILYHPTAPGARLGACTGETVNEILENTRKWHLSPHSRVEECKEPEYWEYKYLTNTRNPISWEEFYESRVKWSGYYIISGNFQEISCAFRLLTRDEKLVQEFKEAFRCNPGCAEMEKYAADCEEYFDGLRKRWGVLPPEENQ